MGEAKPNTEIFRLLAARMGMDDACFADTDDDIAAQAFNKADSRAAHFDWHELKQRGWSKLAIPDAPYAEGGFPTPSGKCEFRSSLAEGGDFVVPVWRSMYEGQQSGDPVDPLPAYIPPFESPALNPALAQRYPLSIVSPKPHAFLNTQYGNEEQKKLRQGAQIVFLHPLDSAAREILPGTVVRVFNERGSFEGPAELSDDLVPGLVMANVGHWPSATISGTSVNAISSDRHSGMGMAGTYSDNLVQVVKVPGARPAANA